MMTPFTSELRVEMIKRGCRDCLYFIPGIYACSRGMPDCVIYEPETPPPVKDPCYGCPYGRREPCVGICMRQVLKDWRDERKEAAVYA